MVMMIRRFIYYYLHLYEVGTPKNFPINTEREDDNDPGRGTRHVSTEVELADESE